MKEKKEKIKEENNIINEKNEDKKEEPKKEAKSDNKNNNNLKDEKKSFENKISEQNNNKDIKAQNSEGKIYHSKSIKENGEKGKSKQKENHHQEEENTGYTKNFKTMRIPKKKNADKEQKGSVTPSGDTPGNDNIPKMKVSKENMIKISTEPVATFYSIVKDLGHGSYGQVKKVKHKELNEIRAMKITNKKSESSKYEIEILKKISHPNITKIFEILTQFPPILNIIKIKVTILKE